jgi:hypothetical protein
MKKYFIFICLILFLILNSCIGAGVGDISEELGNGYSYFTEGSCARITTDFTYKEGIYPNVKKYAFDKNFIIVEQLPSSKSVNSYFVEDLRSKYGFLLYMKDSIKKTKEVKKFMQSKIWTDSIWHKEISREVLPENNVRSFDTLGKIASKIMKEDFYFKEMFSRKINYYIIDKVEQEVYGPFSKEKYLIKRKELKVSETLVFE